MTRWVTRSVIIGVAVTLALAGAATAATATTARTTASVSRPIGNVVVAMLRLVGVQTCVDWRQGVTSNLEPCQTAPSTASTTANAGYGTDSATTRTTSAGGNLAAGRPTVASSALLGSPAAHAVDGSLDTAWRTRGDDEWWAVDLGRTTSLAAVVLNWDSGELPSGFSLLTSPDGDRWKRVGKVHGRPNGGPTVLDLAVKARFVRVNVDGPASYTVALRDVRAFAPVAPPPDKRASRDRRDGGQNAGTGAGVGTGTGAPLTELPDGSETPTIPTGSLPDTEATGFGPATDPVTTAAVLVIVIAGVTSLVVGAQTTKGKHRRKRRRLPAPLTPPSLPKVQARPRSKPAPATPPSLPRVTPAEPAASATPPSLPKAAPVTPPSLPKAPPVTPPSRSLRVVPDKQPRQSRPPHVPRPPIEIRWPDWAKLEWVRPNRAKPGRPTKGDAGKREHTRVGG